MPKCSGKTKHPTQQTAETEAKRINDVKWFKGEFPKWRSYHCRTCGFYHVGRPAQ